MGLNSADCSAAAAKTARLATCHVPTTALDSRGHTKAKANGCNQSSPVVATHRRGQAGTQNFTERAVNKIVNQVGSDEDSRSKSVVVKVKGGVREPGERMVLPR
jgi:hypothetical protein